MYEKLKRNGEKFISDYMVDMGEMIVAKKPFKISIPEYYIGKKLASFGSDIYTVAVFGIIYGDEYFAVSNCPAMIKTVPSNYYQVKIGNDTYYELVYEEGDVYIADKSMVKESRIAKDFNSLLVDQGKDPWFFRSNDPNVDDRLKLFINCEEYAGKRVGSGPAAISLILSATAKSPVDDTVLYRHYVNQNPKNPAPPIYVGLRNIEQIASSTTSRLTGNYYNDSIGASLINKTTRIEGLEKVFRE